MHTEHLVWIEGAGTRGVVDARDLDVTHVDLGAVDVHLAVRRQVEHAEDRRLARARWALDEHGGVLADGVDSGGALVDAEFHDVS